MHRYDLLLFAFRVIYSTTKSKGGKEVIFDFNVTGNECKSLVKTMGEILDVKPKYLGIPSMKYEIECFTISKNGEVEFDDRADREEIENLLIKLEEKGFIPSENISEHRENVGLTVAIPKAMVDVVKLNKIFENKGDLIKKALGINNLEIKEDDEKVSFPWFDDIDEEHLMVYTKFISSLCKMSMTSKRINEYKKEVVNEKYVFRCFLLRLGFIGDEFKMDRKILLEKLSGSSAFRNGGTSDEISK